eukprot:CAMPEP_0194277496 /NCGR_PEP_ID=MMETSP0169-20130528/9813_1 /TAXON_ID=218684 /ORGANISM="Corethron pennatum, Strain L29A3" /LENGTH=284 /DNA_ID=CAMNT_0039021495 /DNA_START=356 /DNA_END=1213 /DNA_ORIENTATION=-
MKRCLAVPDRTRNDCRWIRALTRKGHRVNKRNLQNKIKDCTAPHTETPTRAPTFDPTDLPPSETPTQNPFSWNTPPPTFDPTDFPSLSESNVPTSPPTCFTDSSFEEAVALYISHQETAEEKYGNINSWCISGVTDLSNLFVSDNDDEYNDFNGDLNGWDLSSVTSLVQTFYDARQFNGDISDWNLSSVTDFFGCFYHANSFDQNISTWDLSLVQLFNYAFYGAEAFNQAISGWDVTGGINFNFMFSNAKSFNQCLEWSIMNGAQTSDMFKGSKNGRLGEAGEC